MGIDKASKYAYDNFSIITDFPMYLANAILAKHDDSYRQGLKRVKSASLRRQNEGQKHHFSPLIDIHSLAVDQPRRVLASFFASPGVFIDQH